MTAQPVGLPARRNGFRENPGLTHTQVHQPPGPRTRLLVSVRSAAEAAIALAAGADVIDVKEPARGPLGAADAGVLAAVADAVGGRLPLSAALGELCDRPRPWPAGVAAQLQFIKLGLAGCRAEPNWPQRWREATADYGPKVARVAVIYADWQTAGAPSPSETLAWAAAAGCGAILVDTFDKHGGGLADLWPREAVADLIESAGEIGLPIALAGRLTAAAIRSLLPLKPALVGIRGAACSGGREGRLEADRVRALASIVRTYVPKEPAAQARDMAD